MTQRVQGRILGYFADHPYPQGTQVYNENQRWDGLWRKGGAGHILKTLPQPDGTHHYLVQLDEGIPDPKAGQIVEWIARETWQAGWSP